jgi:ACS family tartrate transporter-like MFS transporter
LRFLLGVAEAGFFPGIILYLTYWFRQREQAQAIAWFMTGIPIASIVGAPVSGWILDRIHWFGLDSWRWLLILEGLPAILSGAVTWLLLPNGPSDAAFLTGGEKHWISAELAREQQEKLGRHKLSAFQAMLHRRVWHLAGALFAAATGLYAMSFWMPQVVKSLSGNYSNTLVGILVVIPHVMGLGAMILVSRSSDRMLERRYHGAVPLVIGGVALFLLGATRSPWLSLALWSLVAMGIYSFCGPFFSVPSGFLAGSAAASGIALLNSVGALGGFFGPSLIGAVTKTPGGIYRGLAIIGGSLFVSAALVLLLPKQPAPSRPPST